MMWFTSNCLQATAHGQLTVISLICSHPMLILTVYFINSKILSLSVRSVDRTDFMIPCSESWLWKKPSLDHRYNLFEKRNGSLGFGIILALHQVCMLHISWNNYYLYFLFACRFWFSTLPWGVWSESNCADIRKNIWWSSYRQWTNLAY